MANKKRKKEDWWRDKPAMEKFMIILPIIIAAASTLYVGLAYHYTKAWDEKAYNSGSYGERLNFKLRWENTEEETTINVMSDSTLLQLSGALPNQKFTVEATTGGIKGVSIIFYKNGETLAVTKLDLSDQIDHSKTDAPSMAYACEVVSIYPSDIKTSGDKILSYLSSLFVVIEGYNDDRYIIPTVFEYGTDSDGNLSGEVGVRQYNDLDTLYTFNKKNKRIPEFDYDVLSDFITLKKALGETSCN